MRAFAMVAAGLALSYGTLWAAEGREGSLSLHNSLPFAVEVAFPSAPDCPLTVIKPGSARRYSVSVQAGRTLYARATFRVKKDVSLLAEGDGEVILDLGVVGEAVFDESMSDVFTRKKVFLVLSEDGLRIKVTGYGGVSDTPRGLGMPQALRNIVAWASKSVAALAE